MKSNKSKKNSYKKINIFTCSMTVLTNMMLVYPVYGLPENAQINSGMADFNNPNSNTLTINQHSQNLSTNWDSFNIAGNETVNFIQPTNHSIALNRVVGGNASQIMGNLNATGQVFLINPQGIFFSQSAQINVGGLLATTLDISEQDFANNQFQFSGDGNGGEIINNGTLKAHSGGTIALAAPIIINNGEIQADDGKVHLQSADGILVEFSDGEIGIAADATAWQGMIDNQGVISAEGGIVMLNANTHDSLYLSVVNNDGIVRATSLATTMGEVNIAVTDGDIVNNGVIDVSAVDENTVGGNISVQGQRFAQLGQLHADGMGNGNGGTVDVHTTEELLISHDAYSSANAGAGIGNGGELIFFSDGATAFTSSATIEARGGQTQGDGGFVEVSGTQHVGVSGIVDTRAYNGLNGTFLIDPTNIEIVSGSIDSNGTFGIGGTWTTQNNLTSQIGTDNITTTLATNNVVINTSTGTDAGELGNITISAAIDLNGGGGASLSLIADNNILVNADICDSVCGGGDEAINLSLAAGGSITTADNINVISGGGTITMTASTIGELISIGLNNSIDAGAGKIVINGDDVIVSGLNSTNTDADSIQVTSQNSIIDRSGLDINTSGGVILIAKTGIHSSGMASTVDIIASQVDVQNITSGKIDLEIDASTDFVNVYSAGDFEVITGTTGTENITFSDPTITFGGNVDIMADNNITLNASLDGAVGDISLEATNGTLTLLDAGISTGNNLTLFANDIVDASGRVLDITANNLTVTTTAAAAATTFNTNVAQLAISQAGNQALNIQEIDGLTVIGLVNDGTTTRLGSTAGNVIVDNAATVTATDLELEALAGTVSITDTGLSVTGDLIMSAQDLKDTAGYDLILAANDLTVTTTAALANTTLNTDVAQLTITQAGNVGLNIVEADDVTVLGLVNNGTITRLASIAGDITLDNTATITVTDLELQALAGTLSVADSGLSVTGDLIMSAQDLKDTAGYDLILAANDLTVTTTAALANTTLNTDVAQLTITQAGNVGLNIVEADDVTVLGLVNNGTITRLASIAGDITLDNTATITATDLTLEALAGTLSVADSGLSVTGDLMLSAQDLKDTNSRDIDLVANGLTIATASTGGAVNFNSTAASLAIDNQGTNTITVAEADSIDITSLRSSGGNISIITAGTGDISVTNDIDTNGSNGATLTLNAANDLNLADNVGLEDSIGGDDVVLMNFIAGNNINYGTTSAGDINSNGGNITFNAGGDFDQQASNVYAGIGKININANEIWLRGNYISDNADSDAININATAFIRDDNSAGTELQAVNGGIVLHAVNGMSIDANSALLTVTNTDNGGIFIKQIGGDVTLNASGVNDDVTIDASNGDIVIDNAALVGNGNLLLSATNGTITIPDVINTSGNVTLSAADIIDQNDRILDITANDLLLKISNAADSTTINSNVVQLDASFANADLFINEANDLTVIDLDADGDSANVSNGNLSLTIANGDLLVTDTVTASDTDSDGIRSGMIDIDIQNGDFTLGNSPAAIFSINNVDQNSDGGLGISPTNQVAIRLRQTSGIDSDQTFTLGDGVASDIQIRADGGDILIDVVGSSVLTGSNLRRVILNSDVSITATKTSGGGDGIIDLQNNSNSGAAILLAGTGSNITIIGYEAEPEPPIELPIETPIELPIELPIETPIELPIEPPVASDYLELIDVISNSVQQGQDIADMSGESIFEPDNAPVSTSVNKVFNAIFNNKSCQDDSTFKQKSECANNHSVKTFLGSLLIGGEMLQ